MVSMIASQKQRVPEGPHLRSPPWKLAGYHLKSNFRSIIIRQRSLKRFFGMLNVSSMSSRWVTPASLSYVSSRSTTSRLVRLRSRAESRILVPIPGAATP